jgi:lysophospholipid acyltransferase (LPLAT)-like uncharacterized protein
MSVFNHHILKEIKWQSVGAAGKLLVNLIFSHARIEQQGWSVVRPHVAARRYVLAFWHSRILMVSYLYQNVGGAILASRSDDGEIIARILRAQGQHLVRGSTRKGGMRALVKLIQIMRNENRPGCVVPDGPQGPRFIVQPGVVLLAQKTGYPIIPITYSAQRVKIFSTWDRFMLPYPATTCRVIYGAPLHIDPKARGARFEASRQALEDELNRITIAADRHFGHQTG